MKKPFLCRSRHKWTVLKEETRSQIKGRVDWEVGKERMASVPEAIQGSGDWFYREEKVSVPPKKRYKPSRMRV